MPARSTRRHPAAAGAHDANALRIVVRSTTNLLDPFLGRCLAMPASRPPRRPARTHRLPPDRTHSGGRLRAARGKHRGQGRVVSGTRPVPDAAILLPFLGSLSSP